MSRTVSTSRDKLVKDIVSYVAIVILIVFFLFPIFWILMTTFKTPADTFKSSFIPYLQFEPTGKNWYGQVVEGFSENFKAILNSAIIGLSSAAIATILGSMAGYALSRFEFRRFMKNIDIITWFLSLRIMPPIALALPFYALMLFVNLIDNLLSVILIHSIFFLPYAVLVSRDAFRQLPIEIEESALVDGCTRLQVFRRIALPLIAPALAAI
ncbi:MAG: carbohydrate ABC transporter permease, partial [Candidatus Caldarchaeales archaeon]